MHANASSLKVLRMPEIQQMRIPNQLIRRADVIALLGAPRLRLLDTNTICSSADEAMPLMRNEPPFGPLRLRGLQVFAQDLTDDERVGTFADALSPHASITTLILFSAQLGTDAAMGRVVDAAIALRMQLLELYDCALTPASLRQLTRLVDSECLFALRIMALGDDPPYDEGPETRNFCRAVQASGLHVDGTGAGGVAIVEETIIVLNQP